MKWWVLYHNPGFSVATWADDVTSLHASRRHVFVISTRRRFRWCKIGFRNDVSWDPLELGIRGSMRHRLSSRWRQTTSVRHVFLISTRRRRIWRKLNIHAKWRDGGFQIYFLSLTLGTPEWGIICHNHDIISLRYSIVNVVDSMVLFWKNLFVNPD